MKTETFESGKYAAGAPYPGIDLVSPDLKSARMLDAPRAGELCSISDYVYYGIIFEKCYPWLSTLFEGIAITEMSHYRLLSELTQSLGRNPAMNVRLRNQAIDLTEDTASAAPRAALRLLRLLVDEEKAVERDYRRIAGMTPDPAAAALLNRISDDEAHHAALLAEAAEKIPLG